MAPSIGRVNLLFIDVYQQIEALMVAIQGFEPRTCGL